MDLLLTVFGAFFLTEFNKTALPWPLHAWVKLCLAVLGAVIMAVLLADELYATASLTLAGAGGSAVVHKAHRLLSDLGDAQRVTVLSRGSRRI
jgi:hypothetical protein